VHIVFLIHLGERHLNVKSAPPGNHRSARKRLLLGVLGVLVLATALIFGVPWIRLTLSTISTDDAYVNGHVTFVAARVSGQIARVLVDDNNRVHKGDVLAQLDKEPFEDAVAVKKAAVDTAKADLRAATASVRGVEAQDSTASERLPGFRALGISPRSLEDELKAILRQDHSRVLLS